MYIYTQNELSIVDSEAFGLFSIQKDRGDIYDKKEGYVILAQTGPDAKPVRLGKYTSRGEAKEILLALYSALADGSEPFDMPEEEEGDEDDV